MSLFEIEVIIIIILTIMAGLVSCFETAITASSRARIHRLENEGDSNATKLEKLLKNREKVISVMLITNNLINIINSALTTKLLLDIFGEIGVLYATIFLTIIIIILGEILPKTIAIQYPEKCALFFVNIIEKLFNLLSPIVNVIQKIIDVLTKNIFTNKNIRTKKSELEEIRDTVDLKAKEGTIFKFEKNLIDGVLDLSDIEISEIMIHRKNVKSIDIDQNISQILKQALDIGYTRIPLWKNSSENIVAILNVRKFLKSLYFNKNDIENFNINEATNPPLYSPNSNTLSSQLFTFRKYKKRFSLIVDEYGSFQGIVTLEDILEEIVGEIKEQDENHENNIIKTKSGLYKIKGNALIRDINKKLNLNIIEKEEAYNLSAYLTNYLGRIPNEKEHIIIDNISFEILSKKNNDIILIKIKKLQNSN